MTVLTDYLADETPSDVAFTLFLASFTPAQFSTVEWDIYQYHRLHRVG